MVALHLLTLFASVTLADTVPCSTRLPTVIPQIEKTLKAASPWSAFRTNQIGFALIDSTSPTQEVLLVGFSEEELDEAKLPLDRCKNFPSVYRFGSYADLIGESALEAGLTRVCSPSANGFCKDKALTALATESGKYIYVGELATGDTVATKTSSALNEVFRAYQADTWKNSGSAGKKTKNLLSDYCSSEALYEIQSERSVLKRFLNRLQFQDPALYQELARELVAARDRLNALPAGPACERFVAESEGVEGTAQYFESMTALALGQSTLEKIVTEWNATYDLLLTQQKFAGSGAFVSFLIEKIDGEHVWQNEIQDGILPVDLLRGLIKNGNLSQARIARMHAARAASLSGSYKIVSNTKRRTRMDFTITLQVAYSPTGNKVQLQTHIELVRGKNANKQKFVADCGGEQPVEIGSLTSGNGQTYTLPAHCSVQVGEGLFPQIHVSIPEAVINDQNSRASVGGIAQVDQTKAIPANFSRQ